MRAHFEKVSSGRASLLAFERHDCSFRFQLQAGADRCCRPLGRQLPSLCLMQRRPGAVLRKLFTQTYNGHVWGSGDNTYGGYSTAITVDEHFVLSFGHDEKHLAAVAPLLCAGITWSPLRYRGTGPGKKVGIGGLGHMGLKLAKALGVHVVAFTFPH
jgi:D-arabinose 1-dehydrogenase-like Zn-dependent alcohol dehydrogenase